MSYDLDKITSKEEAINLYNILFKEAQLHFPDSIPEELETIVKNEIGYATGDYSLEKRQQIETWLNLVHPILGSAFDPQKTPEQLFNIGVGLVIMRDNGRPGLFLYKQPIGFN